MKLLLFGAVALVGCNLGGGVDVGDGRPGADAPLEAEASFEAGRDADADSEDLDEFVGPGPLTHVIERAELVTERLCDLNGDGLGDNSVANLGSSSAGLLATVVTAALDMKIHNDNHWLFHSPWVDDLQGPNDPAMTLIAFTGEAYDVCHGDEEADVSDDFEGEETYCIDLEQLDGCGEPLALDEEAHLEEGALSARFEPLMFFAPLRDARVRGTIARGSRRGHQTLCGYVVPEDVGDHHGFVVVGDLSTLEVFLSGGAALGLPTVPGLDPDIDIDGDGLEHFVMDAESRLARCVDGDGRVVEGRDCWRDEGFVDGFSLTLQAQTVSAHLGEREPTWNTRECGTVLSLLDACEDPSCIPNKTNDVCPEQAHILDALQTCEEAHCADECAPPRADCRACGEVECPTELADCLDAPTCCPISPETSSWDSP